MTRVFRSVAALAIPLVALAGVHVRQATAPRTMHVEGHVVDALSGQPLRGVVVIANVFTGSTSIAPAAAFLTAADGRFVFRDLPAGSVGLFATKVGFLNGEIKPFTITTGRRDDVRVPLMPEGLISGRVLDQFGEPVTNARVKAVLQANVPVGEPGNLLRGVMALSDDTGSFLVGGLEAGLYLLMVEGSSGRTPRSHDQVFFPAAMTADTATAIEVTAGAEHAGAEMMVMVKPGTVNTMPLRPTPTESATGSVSGIVRDDSGRGLSHAVIVMKPPGLAGVLRTILSDESGRFEFDKMPAGRFQFIATRDGYYIPGTTPLAAPPPVEIAVGPSQRESGVVLTLSRAPTLGGRLLDQFGDPIAGSISLRLARTPVAPRYSASANARGQFRIANIVPGDYVLLVDQNPFGRDLRISEGPDHERTVAMLPMYYPGVAETSMATPITISPGADVTGIDVIVRPEPVTTIEVTVDGPPVEFQNLVISRYSLDNPTAPPVRGTMIAGSRQGYVTSTKAGRYLVVASARDALGPPTPLITQPAMSGFWGSAEVSSDGMTPSSISISLQPTGRVSGTVLFEGTATTAFMTASLVPLDAGRPSESSPIGAIGRAESGRAAFRIDLVRPGRYLLRVASLDAKPVWMVKSIVADGREALDRPIDLASGSELSNVIITMSDQISQISGAVAHDRAVRPLASVIAFPADAQQWVRGSMRISSVTVDGEGRYTLRGLPAGDYRLAAYDVTAAPAGDDLPLLLKKLLPASVPVTIRLGEARTQDLSVK